ncbi:DUF4180 domain-containing protein [Chitinophaga pendula]|uniref:DUF4180 domain-containing protein n=1 Tax=Chitinophaga TaxID=79328 RepID=UPI000BAEB90D|nr:MULTISPECIES: DUF4180 domain-containing protein [Chitinophaga]ASZ12729.1 alpha/beta hydrolase [Chitinophaga sp. MD30]UCJ09655.1 DUF4180 domain-containing protein [Chitinophaga pendula]
MEIILHNINGHTIAQIQSDGIAIHNTADALDVIGNVRYQGAGSIIVESGQLHPDFFDLKTGVAGDILQKFSTYDTRLAIVGDFSIFNSNALRDFIYESNKGGRVNFVATIAEAREKLSK